MGNADLERILDAGFITLVVNSIELALITSVLATLLALAICYTRRLQPRHNDELAQPPAGHGLCRSGVP